LHGVDGDSAQGGDDAGRSSAEDKECGDRGEDERDRVTVLGPVDEDLVEGEEDQEYSEQATGDGDANVTANNPEYAGILRSATASWCMRNRVSGE